MSQTTVIHHSADYDGIFSREVARKFVHGAQLIGWDFGQALIPNPEGHVIVVDLPPECLTDPSELISEHRITWIDHHKSAIDKWRIPGYQIDGVAACRLFYQYSTVPSKTLLPAKGDFTERRVKEPLALTLAGEYDVWDHAKSEGLDVTFQFALDAIPDLSWNDLLDPELSETYVASMIGAGKAARECIRKRDAEIILDRGFDLKFEDITFLALNTSRKGSQQFEAGLKDHHDASLAFFWNGNQWVVGMYHDRSGDRDIDLSKIAVKHGGGGHRRACGFQAKTLPWLTQ